MRSDETFAVLHDHVRNHALIASGLGIATVALLVQSMALASIVGARYLAMGTGDTELYIFAGMLAAVVIAVRVFLFRGAGRAS